MVQKSLISIFFQICFDIFQSTTRCDLGSTPDDLYLVSYRYQYFLENLISIFFKICLLILTFFKIYLSISMSIFVKFVDIFLKSVAILIIKTANTQIIPRSSWWAEEGPPLLPGEHGGKATLRKSWIPSEIWFPGNMIIRKGSPEKRIEFLVKYGITLSQCIEDKCGSPKPEKSFFWNLKSIQFSIFVINIRNMYEKCICSMHYSS